MSDGMTEGYRSNLEFELYEVFLDSLFFYLINPTSSCLDECINNSQYFGKYYGTWMVGDEDKKYSKIRDLKDGDKQAWANLLARCIYEEINFTIINNLKSESPFSDKYIVVVNKKYSCMVIRGDFNEVFKGKESFSISNGDHLVLL